MSKSEAAIGRARSLLGVRFVAQGRDPAVGLDCVGLMLRAYAIDAAGVRDDYRLGGAHRAAILHFCKTRFRRVARSRMRAGDMLLFGPSALQWHLGIWTGESVIHADARARLVIERPGAAPWPLAAVLRPRVRLARGI